MFQKFEIRGVHTTVNDSLHKYVTRKIGGLDRYVSRHARASAHADVHLKEVKSKDNNRHVCEVTIRLPHQTIVIKERALNMFAAVDIVEVKLKQQLQKYKEQHGSGKIHRRVVSRFLQRQPQAID